MNIKPIGNRLVVKLIKKNQTSASGIIISTEDKDEKAKGEVVAIGGGQGKEDNITELGLKIGDKIIFGQYAGDEVSDDAQHDVTYKILSGKDVLAIIS